MTDTPNELGLYSSTPGGVPFRPLRARWVTISKGATTAGVTSFKQVAEVATNEKNGGWTVMLDPTAAGETYVAVWGSHGDARDNQYFLAFTVPNVTTLVNARANRTAAPPWLGQISNLIADV